MLYLFQKHFGGENLKQTLNHRVNPLNQFKLNQLKQPLITLLVSLLTSYFALQTWAPSALAASQCREYLSSSVEVRHLSDLYRAYSVAGRRIRLQRQQLKNWQKRRQKKQPVLILAVPSTNLPKAELEGVLGDMYYEHRSLWKILEVRDPSVRVLFVTSTPVSESTIKHLFEGLPQTEIKQMRRRFKIISLEDISSEYLSEKLRTRPNALEKVRQAAQRLLGEEMNGNNSILSGFISDIHLEHLATTLGLSIKDIHPLLSYLNSKSGNREAAAEAHIPYPVGFNHNRSKNDVIHAIDSLYKKNKGKGSAFVKPNWGTSGSGIIHVPFDQLGLSPNSFTHGNRTQDLKVRQRQDQERHKKIRQFLEQAEDNGLTGEKLWARILKHGAVTENGVTHSQAPSVQMHIEVDGKITLLSTHMQLLSGYVYKGSRQPAYTDPQLTKMLTDYALSYAKTLAKYQVIGRVSLDFFEITKPDGKIDFVFGEANIREGGTTHPRETVALLLDAYYDPSIGGLISRSTGKQVFYSMTDNFVDTETFKGVDFEKVWAKFITRPEYKQLRFNLQTGRGVKFHMLAALSPIGKIGLTAFGDSPAQAEMLFKTAKNLLMDTVHQLKP